CPMPTPYPNPLYLYIMLSLLCLIAFSIYGYADLSHPHSFPTRRSSDLCRRLQPRVFLLNCATAATWIALLKVSSRKPLVPSWSAWRVPCALFLSARTCSSRTVAD